MWRGFIIQWFFYNNRLFGGRNTESQCHNQRTRWRCCAPERVSSFIVVLISWKITEHRGVWRLIRRNQRLLFLEEAVGFLRGNRPIDVTSYKYLEVTLTPRLSFQAHTEVRVSMAKMQSGQTLIFKVWFHCQIRFNFIIQSLDPSRVTSLQFGGLNSTMYWRNYCAFS